MLNALQTPLRFFFDRLSDLFDKPFGPPWNPMRQLGTLTFFFFWVAAVTGIYVYVLFDTTVLGAFASVDYMSTEQWYLAGVMRSLHRYSSDAMVVTTALHLLREFSLDRYRGARWFAWFTGVPLIWLLYTSGISGYWLVWDEMAQYVAIGSMEWLDALGISGGAVADNFLTRGSLDDRFFSLLVFIHIFAPLFLLFAMWIHVIRVNQAKTNPPRGLALGSLAMLTVLAFAVPAVSHQQADLGTIPMVVNLDWFYMFLYPIFDAIGPGPMWAVAVGSSVMICAMPWLPPLKVAKSPEVFLDQCNGCTRCFDDCPYGAVIMKPRTDGRAFLEQAVVDPDLCTQCGICVGTCPTSTPYRVGSDLVTGIDLPDLPLRDVREKMVSAMATARSEASAERPSLLLVRCEHGADAAAANRQAVGTLDLPCIGMLPPSFIDFALSDNRVDGVVLTGCNECDCHHRLGVRWTEDRVAGLREPYLRKRVSRDRILTCWAGWSERDRLDTEIDRFRNQLKSHAAGTAAAEDAS